MRSSLCGILAAIIASVMGFALAQTADGQDREDQFHSANETTPAMQAPRASPLLKTAGPHRSRPWDELAAADSAPRLMHRGFPMFHRTRFERDEDLLDERIRQVARNVAAVEQETELPTGDNSGLFSVGDLTPFSFRLMGYASIIVAIYGLIVVIRHRPKFAGLRGKNESRDARRTVVRSIVALVVLNLADLGFTSLLVPTRSFVELNPLADSLLDSLPMLILVKSALIGGGTLLLLLLWRHKIAQLASWGTAVTYVFAAMWWVMYFHTATS
jgi:hypothetical protein